ncbi:1239_t:CDS:2, partial [Acaulospora morrowiae]
MQILSRDAVTRPNENKEIDEFLDLKSEERVSCEIKQRNREKKLQCESAKDRSQNLVSDTSISPEQNHERPGGESPNHKIHVFEEPDEIEPAKSQCIEQGLTKELQ